MYFGSGGYYGAGNYYGGGEAPSSPAAGVTLDPKHDTIIGYAFSYVDQDGVLVWVKDQVVFDVDLIAEVWSIAVEYASDGEVLPSFNGDDDCTAIYFTIGINTTPADPTTGSASITGRSGQPGSTGVFADYGDTVTVKAAGEDSDGNLGPVLQKVWVRGDASTFRPHIQATAIRSGDTVTVTLSVQDTALAVTDIEFRKQDSGGTLGGTWLTSWDTSVGTIGSSVNLTRAEGLTSADGLDAQFLWRVQYTDENGDSRVIGDSIDLGKLKQVTKTLRIASTDWSPSSPSTDWVLTGSYVRVGTAGNTITMYKSIELPPNVVVTSVKGRGLRTNAGDECEFRFWGEADGDLFTAALVILTLSASASEQTESASTSITISATKAYFARVQVGLDGASATTDAYAKYLEFTYDVPSYAYTI